MNILHRLRSLTKDEIGPWWPYRHYVYDELQAMGVKPGDIFCREGNAFLYGFFPFSKFICYLTGSKYSHAAIAIDTKEDILLADVDRGGLNRAFIYDWCNAIRGNDFSVLRYNGAYGNEKAIPALAVENAKKLIKLDPRKESDFKDDDSINFYCVELVCWCYLRAGILLCKDVPIKDLPGWKKWLNPIAKLEGIDYNHPVWCVGNEKIGLMSSPALRLVGTVKLPQGTTAKRFSKLRLNGA